jgi:hypothetical protein
MSSKFTIDLAIDFRDDYLSNILLSNLIFFLLLSSNIIDKLTELF